MQTIDTYNRSGKIVFKHGMRYHSLYRLWHGVRSRCNNPKDKDYARYGGRGIKVCSRWNNFALFVADMGERPSPQHSLDRIDNDGDYEPSNCRWATRKEQTHNSRVVKLSVRIVGEIRKAYAKGDITQLSLATKFGTHQSVISRIISKKIW